MEHFREKDDTAENQDRRLELTSTFIDYSFQVLSRHEARVRQFYSPVRQIENPIHVSAFIEGQQVLPISEFSK
jgi:hypothetical protein